MQSQSYNAFRQHIHQAAESKAFPLRAMFELTYRCNFKCRHCYVPESYRKKGELKTKQICSVLEQLRAIGCFYLGFTGGELFIRKDVMEILWNAKKMGFELIISTNGSLIDERMASQLERLRPNKVDITIPAMSKPAFERITGTDGSHRMVFNAIDLLYKRGISLGFRTCVLKENAAEIKDVEDFARSLGALHRLDDALLPRLNGSREPFTHRGGLCTARQAPHVVPHGSYVANERRKDSRNLDSLFTCGVGISQAAITPLGELKMCLMIDYPKYRILSPVTGDPSHAAGQASGGLEIAWVKLKELVRGIKADKNYQCNTCELYAYCKWCPARAWLYNQSFTSCEPETRLRARINKRTFAGDIRKPT
jgi:radical SAM protein with 4Fe4S-binding SPASM domain